MTRPQKTKKKSQCAAVTPISADKNQAAVRILSELPELEIADRKKDAARTRQGSMDE